MSNRCCPLCNTSSKNQTVRATHVYGSEKGHVFWQCGNCDLVYIDPVPTQEEESFFYANEFEKYMSKRALGERDWSGAIAHIKTNQDHVFRRYKVLKTFLKPGTNILEIGCSSGFMMEKFRDEGFQVTGVEPSSKFTEFLKENNFETYTSMEELVQRNPMTKYEAIVHFFVMEHIRDTKQFIQTQLDMLTDEGQIIAEIPCVNDPLTSVYNIPAFEKFYWHIAHHYYFSPKSIQLLLDTMNLKYEIIPEQRYDLSNHIVWMTEGKPGGQGLYNHIFSLETLESYRTDLTRTWNCDTMFVRIWR